MNKINNFCLILRKRIKQGIIRLPKQYNEYENAQVRIIMLVETPKNQLCQREKLLITFNKMK